ncbi:GGDEF domain-containing protein [Actinoplanes sp. NPDC051411]|uniref:GGDEF domain-containing protein n=1 Tax=Actinoplanes sp. NPDC051411 TaxID=3155522 RepID=UPI003415C7AC
MAYQLRDQHGASRAVAYLMMTAAPFIFITFLMVPGQPVSHLVAVSVTCVVLAVGGVFARLRPDRMPRWFWVIAPFFAIMVVTGMNLVTEDASTGAQLFYLWPVLYSANFLSRRVVYLTMAGVSVTEASVVFPLLPTIGDAASDWVSMTVAMTLIAIIVLSLRDRADRLRDVLETQALADALTGVANRRSFDVELARAVAWSRSTGEPVALITIDVDHFKGINDTWGHAVGDQALQAVATSLEQVAQGDGDVVARLGGDEFVMLLRTGDEGARRAADDVRAVLARVASLPGGPPGLSIGIAVLPDHAGTPEELMGASDAALYEAKLHGRGRTESHLREPAVP